MTLGVIALTAWTIWDAHRVGWNHAIQTSENLVSALAHDIDRNIEIYDSSLRTVIDGLNLSELSAASSSLRDRVLFDGALSAQDLGAIFILDAQGDVLLESQSRERSYENFADRDYFKVHRDRPDIGLYVSAPYKGRLSGDWSIAISRRITRPDGSFAGVIGGSLRLSYFKRLFEGLDLGPDGVASLIRTDGRVIMRAPLREEQLNADLSGVPLFKRLLEASAGYFQGAATLDGVDRLYVYQHLGNFPLILSIGVASDTIVAEWREKAIITISATAALLFILALLMVAMRRAVHRAERADAMLVEAIESISEGFVIYDKDDRLVMCNDAYRKLYPRNADLMVPGARYVDIVRAGLANGQTLDAVGREEEWLAKRLAERLDGPQEHRLWDGRWVLTSERRMPSGGIAGLRIDITALKEVQASLSESQAELLRAQRVSNTGSVVKDFRTGEAAWSEQTYRIFGVTPDRFSPSTETFLKLVHPEDYDRVVASIAASEKGVILGPLQYRIIRPDGETRWVYREAEVVFDKKGAPIGRVSTYKDITEQINAKQRQEELETQLRHSQKLEALGTLAGGIAHDLNNTLVPILALSKLGMKRLSPGSPDHQDLEVIARASEQARDLVKQILAFSRKQEAEKHEVDIATVMRESMQMLRASLPSTIRIIERIEDVPPIFADRNQLHQIVTNLVTNAGQAIGDKIGTITVTVRCADAADGLPIGAGPAICLTVADTGCGMDEAIIERVFEPFFTTKEVGHGSGLGLAVVHGIVTGHGGRITCSSKLGEGTEFKVILPIASGARRPADMIAPAA